MLHHFVIVENFSYLIKELGSFVDPNIKYSSVKQPELKGGKRRIYRADKHFSYYTFAKNAKIFLLGKELVNFNQSQTTGKKIECEKWDVSHPAFKDPSLGETYPGTEEPYSCLITSRDSLKNNTASRYYVSCNCPDFRMVFKSQLISKGYTSADGSLPKPSGKLAQAPAICKHLYTILIRQYGDIIKKETGSIESALVSPTSALSNLKPEEQSIEDLAKTIDKNKAKQIIEKSLKYYNNIISSNTKESYRIRNGRTFSQYKFGLSFLGLARLLNRPYYAIRTVTNDKRLPLIDDKKNIYHKDLIAYIYGFFSKDELMELIKSNTTPLSPNLQEEIKKFEGFSALLEGIDVIELSISSSIFSILE